MVTKLSPSPILLATWLQTSITTSFPNHVATKTFPITTFANHILAKICHYLSLTTWLQKHFSPPPFQTNVTAPHWTPSNFTAPPSTQITTHSTPTARSSRELPYTRPQTFTKKMATEMFAESLTFNN